VVATFQEEPTPTPVPPASAPVEGVIAEGNVMPAQYLYLAFPTGGRVEQILVEEGASVAEGDVLASLGEREQAQASLSTATLELESAQQALDSLNENATLANAQAWQALINANENINVAQIAWDEVDTDEFQDSIDDANQEVVDAQKAVDDAQEEFDKYADFADDNPNRVKFEKELEDAENALHEAVLEHDRLVNQKDMAQANLQAAQAAYDIAEADYNSTLEGPDPDTLHLAELRLANAQAQVDAAQMMLDNMDLRAPFSGTIIDINIKPQELVGTDKWAILIADELQWYVETNDLSELEVVDIEIGQEVTLLPDALPDVILTGEVTEISQMFTSQTGDILYACAS
jgi:multidrug resistance efflux pump